MSGQYEYLHAHWRMPYIQAGSGDDNPGGNPFLRIPEAENERSVLLLYRGTHTYLVMNKFPYNAGHLLAVPYREVGDLEELDETESSDLWATILRAKRLLRLALDPAGFNIGFNLGDAAGAGIPTHLHCHIVPRWTGDTNFLPILSGTRVLPEAMETMWERLRSFVPQVSG